MGRSFRRHAARAPLITAVAFALLAALAASASTAATFAQARAQLRSWHLRPRPLFPSRLPAAHRNAPVTVIRIRNTPSQEFWFYFGGSSGHDCHTNPNPYAWCVGLSRGIGTPVPPPQRAARISRLRIGRRHVYFWYDEGNAGGWYMTWSENGRAYALWAWVDNRAQALARLRPFIKTLHPV